MLYIYNNDNQSVTSGANVVFDTTGIQTGVTVTRSLSGGTIFLNRPGFYSIDFSATGFATSTAGEITIDMYVNGAIYNGASGSEYSGGTSEVVNIAYPAIVQVTPCCGCVRVPITFRNDGIDTTYTNVVVKVTKIA